MTHEFFMNYDYMNYCIPLVRIFDKSHGQLHD